MKVSIVIPTYNRSELLYRVLSSLGRQLATDYEILISVDDDDPTHFERTIQVIKNFQEVLLPIKWFNTAQYKRGNGWSVETYPYNVGIKQATGDIIILNSGDVLSITNTIEEHIAAQETHSGAIFSTVHGMDRSIDLDALDWEDYPRNLLFPGSTEHMYCGVGQSYAKDTSKESGYVESFRPYHYQMSIRREVLLSIGGFDETYYGHMGGGDDDLAKRLELSGCDFTYLENTLAVHQWHPQPSKFAATNNDLQGIKPSEYYEKVSQHGTIIRNVGCAWGSFPREKLCVE